MNETLTPEIFPPLELVLKGGDATKVVLWGCGKCHLSKTSYEDAVACCAPHFCETCGVQIKSYCEACSKKKEHARNKAAWEKAKKVMLSEYAENWVYCDHCSEYYADAWELIEDHEDLDDEDVPTWVYGTYEVKFSLDAREIVCEELERQEFYEDADENIKTEAFQELQDFLDGWSKRQDLTAYMVDHGTVVDIEAVVLQRRRDRDNVPPDAGGSL